MLSEGLLLKWGQSDGTLSTRRILYFDGGMYKQRVCVYDESNDKYIVEEVPCNTNNRMEYAALKKAITIAITSKVPILIFGDSQLVINQVLGDWGVKNHTLRKCRADVRNLLKECKVPVEIRWVRRHLNKAGVHLDVLKHTEERQVVTV